MQLVGPGEELGRTATDEHECNRFVGACHLLQRYERGLGRAVALHCEIVAEAPCEVREQLAQRARVVIDHEEHRPCHLSEPTEESHLYLRDAVTMQHRYVPAGTATSTFSPTRWPRSAFARGDSTEMRASSTDASTACTITKASLVPSSSRIVTVSPTSTSCGSSGAMCEAAVCSRKSSILLCSASARMCSWTNSRLGSDSSRAARMI